MILIRLEICNIRQYEKHEIFFPESGLIGLIGANGAGKSTIANTIQWILYSKYEEVTNDEIRNNSKNKRDAVYGVLDFKLNNSFYRIKRSLSSAESQNFVQKDGKTIASGTRSINEYIENNLLKMDYKSFKACFYAAQDDFDALVKMNNAPRVAMLTKLLQLDSIDTAAEEHRSDRKLLETELSIAKRMLVDETLINEQLDTCVTKLAELDSQILEKDSFLENLKNDLTEIALEVQRNETTYKEYLKILSVRDGANEKIRVFNETLTRLNNELSNVNQISNELKGMASKKDQYLTLLTEKDALVEKKDVYVTLYNLRKHLSVQNGFKDERTKTLTSLLTNKEILLTKLSNAEENLTSFSHAEQELKNTDKSIYEATFAASNNKKTQFELTVKMKNLQSLNINYPCPTCSQNMDETHRDNELKSLIENKRNLEAELIRINDNLNALNNKKNVLVNEYNSWVSFSEKHREIERNIGIIENSLAHEHSNLTNLESTIEDLNNQIVDLPDISDFSPEAYKVLLEEIERLKPFYERYTSLLNSTRKENDIRLEIEDYINKINEGDFVLSKLEHRIQEIDFNEVRYKSIQEKFHKQNDIRIKELELINTLKLEQNSLSNRITQLKSQLEENSSKLEKLKVTEKEIINFNKLDFLYKGYKGDKLAKLAPELGKMISRLLKVATDGLFDRVELEDTTYKLKVYNSSTLMNFESFSGAQKKIISICQRIAISQLLSTISKTKIQMIIFDEAFGSLDSQNQDNVVELFRRLSSIFPQIIIIAHNDYLKEQFDHTLEIEQEIKGQERKSKPKWLKNMANEDTFDVNEIKKVIYNNYSTI